MFFFSSRRRHTRCGRDWSSDVCSSDLVDLFQFALKWDGLKIDVDSRTVNHVLDSGDVGGGISLLGEEFFGEEGAAPYVDRRIFGPTPLGVAFLFEITSIVKQHGQQTKFKHLDRERR